jgi:RNA polymerase sigma factor (sigma-70 family)
MMVRERITTDRTAGMTDAEAVASVEGLIRQYANRVAGGHLDFDDLMQEGRLGALQAWHKFDPTRGAFTTYAGRWIQRNMQRYAMYYKPGMAGPMHFGTKPVFPEITSFDVLDGFQYLGHEEDYGRSARWSEIEDVLAGLTPDERHMYLRKHYHGDNLTEIGQRHWLSGEAASGQTFRDHVSRERVRQKLVAVQEKVNKRRRSLEAMASVSEWQHSRTVRAA